MRLEELFKNSTLKPKEKTAQLSEFFLESSQNIEEAVNFASTAKDQVKATVIEALEFASQKKPAIVDNKTFLFVVDSLSAKAPRIKWESAKVIANTASLHAKTLDSAITNLLVNTEHSGIVVRWSAATALAAILKLKTKHNKELLPALKNICDQEEKNSIKKIYQSAFKSIDS
jgi:hypothetical protein